MRAPRRVRPPARTNARAACSLALAGMYGQSSEAGSLEMSTISTSQLSALGRSGARQAGAVLTGELVIERRLGRRDLGLLRGHGRLDTLLAGGVRLALLGELAGGLLGSGGLLALALLLEPCAVRLLLQPRTFGIALADEVRLDRGGDGHSRAAGARLQIGEESINDASSLQVGLLGRDAIGLDVLDRGVDRLDDVLPSAG